jgi:hypothetical protein
MERAWAAVRRTAYDASFAFMIRLAGHSALPWQELN